MTPKEKAIELFEKYCYEIKTEQNYSGYYTNVIYAKNCALIAINEIQEYIIKYDNHVPDFKYWEEVKKEIQNL